MRYKFQLFFLTFLISTICTFLFSSCNESTLKKTETNFAIKDTSLITKIIITSNNEQLTLEKKNYSWLINGKFIANKTEIDRTLITLNLIELKSPLPENAIETVLKKIKTQTHVEIYDKEKVIKSFYLGDFSNNSGNIILLDESETPYICYIPTFNFDLRLNFNLDEKSWMSKVIFHYSSDEIKQIKLTNNDLNEGFCLNIENNNYTVSQTCNSDEFNNVDKDAVSHYLSYFENVTFVNYFENYEQSTIDSLLKETYSFEIQIIDTNNEQIELKAYPMIFENMKDKNNFVGLLNKKELILAKYYDFDLIMKNYTYFLAQ
ncbi:MAG: DUF4340 domain-containing protein [Bacteroidales bacterium]|nr:DUF4340 domain-containing protein [Bacteroidales bacterium]